MKGLCIAMQTLDYKLTDFGWTVRLNFKLENGFPVFTSALLYAENDPKWAAAAVPLNAIPEKELRALQFEIELAMQDERERDRRWAEMRRSISDFDHETGIRKSGEI